MEDSYEETPKIEDYELSELMRLRRQCDEVGNMLGIVATLNMRDCGEIVKRISR